MDKKELTLQEKLEAKAKKTKEGFDKVGKWIKENPKQATELALGVLVGIGAAGKGIASLDRRITVHKDQIDRQRNIYDPTLDIYWKTKRGLNSYEALEFQRRVAAGERRGDVLHDMGVLKR